MKHKMCVLIFFTTLSQRFLIRRRVERDIIINIDNLARNAHVLYCHPWPVWLYHIFSTLSHKGHDFWKKVMKVCFDLLHNFCLKDFSLEEELSEILL